MSKPINIPHKFSLLYFGSAGSALLLGVPLSASLKYREDKQCRQYALKISFGL